MKIEKRSGKWERKILISLITSDTILGRVASIWNNHLFASKWANTIASWCVAYYRSYSESPKRSIEGIYSSWEERYSDPDTAELIEKFLESLSDEYQNVDRISDDYLLDQAGEYFNRVKLNRLKDELEGLLDSGDLSKAEHLVSNHAKIELGIGAGIDLFVDEESVNSTFLKSESRVLIEYPGALGRFFQDAFERDSFVSFFGPEKVGKTFWLIDVAWRAMLQRRKVAFFAVGDMSERQMKERLLVRAAQWPIRNPERKWPLFIKKPVNIRFVKNQGPSVSYEEIEFKKPLNKKVAWESCQKVMKDKVRSKSSYFRLSVHPNSSINVMGIKSIVETWALHDWIPDVIVIDYADILAPPAGKLEYRDQINTTWKQLRSLSQELHCCIVTATQSDAASYDSFLLGKKNFSEDKRKLSHVTVMFGINQTAEEKDIGVIRLNIVGLREGDFRTKRCVYTTPCLALANPCVKSAFPS